MGKIILTGDRPTGKLHLGHYIGSLQRRVQLQNAGDFDRMFVFMADVQALTDNADNPEKIRQNITEVALDYLSAGLDPQKCTLYIQSMIPELAELTTYLMNLISVSRVLHTDKPARESIESEHGRRSPDTDIAISAGQFYDISFRRHRPQSAADNPSLQDKEQESYPYADAQRTNQKPQHFGKVSPAQSL